MLPPPLTVAPLTLPASPPADACMHAPALSPSEAGLPAASPHASAAAATTPSSSYLLATPGSRAASSAWLDTLTLSPMDARMTPGGTTKQQHPSKATIFSIVHQRGAAAAASAAANLRSPMQPPSASPSPALDASTGLTVAHTDDNDTVSSLLALTPTLPNRNSAFRTAQQQQQQLGSPMPVSAPSGQQTPAPTSNSMHMSLSPMMHLKGGSHAHIGALDSPGMAAMHHAHLGSESGGNPAARLIARARAHIPMSPSSMLGAGMGLRSGAHAHVGSSPSPRSHLADASSHDHLRTHTLQQAQSAALKQHVPAHSSMQLQYGSSPDAAAAKDVSPTPTASAPTVNGSGSTMNTRSSGSNAAGGMRTVFQINSSGKQGSASSAASQRSAGSATHAPASAPVAAATGPTPSSAPGSGSMSHKPQRSCNKKLGFNDKQSTVPQASPRTAVAQKRAAAAAAAATQVAATSSTEQQLESPAESKMQDTREYRHSPASARNLMAPSTTHNLLASPASARITHPHSESLLASPSQPLLSASNKHARGGGLLSSTGANTPDNLLSPPLALGLGLLGLPVPLSASTSPPIPFRTHSASPSPFHPGSSPSPVLGQHHHMMHSHMHMHAPGGMQAHGAALNGQQASVTPTLRHSPATLSSPGAPLGMFSPPFSPASAHGLHSGQRRSVSIGGSASLSLSQQSSQSPSPAPALVASTSDQLVPAASTLSAQVPQFTTSLAADSKLPVPLPVKGGPEESKAAPAVPAPAPVTLTTSKASKVLATLESPRPERHSHRIASTAALAAERAAAAALTQARESATTPVAAPSSFPAGPNPLSVSGCKGCNCKKSRCLKLYCECFARQGYCGSDCKCNSCQNLPMFESERDRAITATLERDPRAFFRAHAATNAAGTALPVGPALDRQGQQVHPKGCSCKKSECLKKYCECFQAGLPCTSACKCTHCKNGRGHAHSHSHDDDAHGGVATPASGRKKVSGGNAARSSGAKVSQKRSAVMMAGDEAQLEVSSSKKHSSGGSSKAQRDRHQREMQALQSDASDQAYDMPPMQPASHAPSSGDSTLSPATSNSTASSGGAPSQTRAHHTSMSHNVRAQAPGTFGAAVPLGSGLLAGLGFSNQLLSLAPLAHRKHRPSEDTLETDSDFTSERGDSMHEAAPGSHMARMIAANAAAHTLHTPIKRARVGEKRGAELSAAETLMEVGASPSRPLVPPPHAAHATYARLTPQLGNAGYLSAAAALSPVSAISSSLSSIHTPNSKRSRSAADGAGNNAVVGIASPVAPLFSPLRSSHAGSPLAPSPFPHASINLSASPTPPGLAPSLPPSLSSSRVVRIDAHSVATGAPLFPSHTLGLTSAHAAQAARRRHAHADAAAPTTVAVS